MAGAAQDLHGLVELDHEVCLVLLASVPLGRFVHTRHALPVVRPVNFLLLPDAVYLRTERGGSVHHAAQQGAVVAFEADDYDSAGRYGWSVVVLGRAEHVTERGRLAQLARLPLSPWATGERQEVVRVPLELVTGRRAGGPALDLQP